MTLQVWQARDEGYQADPTVLSLVRNLSVYTCIALMQEPYSAQSSTVKIRISAP